MLCIFYIYYQKTLFKFAITITLIAGLALKNPLFLHKHRDQKAQTQDCKESALRWECQHSCPWSTDLIIIAQKSHRQKNKLKMITHNTPQNIHLDAPEINAV